MPAASTHRDDLVRIIEVDAFDPDGRAENRGRKWAGQVLFEHREESDVLFGLAIGIDDGFFNQLFESTSCELRMFRRHRGGTG